MNSITKRWVRGSLTFIIGMLVVAGAAIAMLTTSSYYSGARQSMLNRVSSLNSQLALYAGSEREYAELLYRAIERFEEGDKFELMLVNVHGDVVASSSGFIPQEGVLEDYEEATLDSGGTGEYIGALGEEARVMAISVLVERPASDIAALRIVTSLKRVDERIFSALMLVFFVMAMILVAAIASGLYFVSSIVNPVAKIEKTAMRIAAGDFDVRVEPGEGDELGTLTNTINEMAEELGRAAIMKNDFISSVSHELRTPLTAIKGWAETLGKVQPGDESYKRGVQVILGETDRLYGMVEELLDFSRMQSAGLTLEKEKLDVNAEVQDALIMFQQRAAEERKTLVFEDESKVYPVMADKNRMRQVLVNVLDNALKYTPAGGKIYIETTQDGDMVQTTIRDEGRGISEKDLASVKVKFYKGENSERGSGIGLAVADEIILAHGGELVMQSGTEGGAPGTAVAIRLPLCQNEE